MRAAADAEHAAQPHSQPKQWDATRLLNLQANHSVVVEGRDDGRVFFCALGARYRLTAPEDISGTLHLLRLHASGDRLVVRDFTCPNTTPRAQSVRSSAVSSGGIFSPSTILPARPRAARARGASGASEDSSLSSLGVDGRGGGCTALAACCPHPQRSAQLRFPHRRSSRWDASAVTRSRSAPTPSSARTRCSTNRRQSCRSLPP